MPQQWGLEAVKQEYAACKNTLPDPVRLRIHRSFSWLQQAVNSSDDDVKFMCLWVAFNAAYAKDLQSRLPSADKVGFREFLQKVCRHQHQDLHHLVWDTYSQGIRNLLNNQYVFQPFWDFHNGLVSESAWQEEFETAKKKSLRALKDNDTSTVLMVAFERIYTLRNQIFHGGATCGSQVNRMQLKCATGILMDTIPLFLHTMLTHPNEAVWGKPYYPVVID